MRLIAKFNLLTITLILLTALSIGAFVVHDELEESYGELTRQGVSIATMVAKHSEYGIYAENEETLQQIAEHVGSHSGIAHVAIHNKDNRVLVEKTGYPLKTGQFGVGRVL